MQKQTRTQNFSEIDSTILIEWEQSYYQTKLITEWIICKKKNPYPSTFTMN